MAVSGDAGPKVESEGDGVMFPIRMAFTEGDAVGVQRAFNNIDGEAVRKHGYQTADHTVAALSDVTCMVFQPPRHISMSVQALLPAAPGRG